MKEQYSYVYILTDSANSIFFTGSTSRTLKQQVWEHKEKSNANKLVYYEIFENILDALDRQKQIKTNARADKIWLIEKMNPVWRDLYEDLT